MTRRILFMLLFMLAVQAHAANFLTGQKLYEMLIDQDPFTRAQASGYVVGVTDANNGLGPTKANWCFVVPNGSSSLQLLTAVTQFLEKNPAKRQLGAASLVEEALAKAYPCKQK
jgi:hypothetical protein